MFQLLAIARHGAEVLHKFYIFTCQLASYELKAHDVNMQLNAAEKHGQLNFREQPNSLTYLSYCQAEHVYSILYSNLWNWQQPSHSVQHQRAAMFVSIINV